MHADHTLRLPAGEYAKLAPTRTHRHVSEQPAAEIAPSAADVVRARVRTRRPVHHLSGFARS
jgi:hypothetical protein